MTGAATFDALARTLADARARFGDAAFRDRRRLLGLLADHMPEAKREIRAIGTAIDEDVPTALQRAERHLIGMEMDRQAERLEAMTGLRIDIARSVVRAFAFGLGIGPLPSIYVAAEASAPSPTQPAPPIAEAEAKAAPDGPGTIRIAGRSVPRHHLLLATAGIAAVLILPNLIGGAGTDSAAPPPQAPMDMPATADAAPPPEAPAIPPASGRDKAVADANYAEESSDFGVPEQKALQNDVGTATPLGIPVGRRVTTAEVQRLVTSDPATLLIDVLDAPHGQTIRGARFMPGLGNGGTLSDGIQARLEQALAAATGNDRTRKLVFFCYGSHCWESYNAALRAATARYTNIYWYRGGLSAWQAAGLPMTPTPAPSG